MKAHVIENGQIKNTIVVKSLDAVPRKRLVPACGNIGDLYDEKTGTATPDPAVVAENEAKAAEAAIEAENKAGIKESAFYKTTESKTMTEIGDWIDTQLSSQAKWTDEQKADWLTANEADSNVRAVIGSLMEDNKKFKEIIKTMAKGFALLIKKEIKRAE
jgi:hypothetical protein